MDTDLGKKNLLHILKKKNKNKKNNKKKKKRENSSKTENRIEIKYLCSNNKCSRLFAYF